MSCWAKSLLCYLQKLWLRQNPLVLTGANLMLSVNTYVALKRHVIIRHQVTEDHKLWQQKTEQVWGEESQSGTAIPAEASQYASQQQWRHLYTHMLV